MRKRLVTTLLIGFIVALGLLCLSACGDKEVFVSGKTYECVSVIVANDESLTNDYTEGYKGMKIQFLADGTIVSDFLPSDATYTQNGKEVTITSDDCDDFVGPVEDNKLKLMQTIMVNKLIDLTFNFKLVTE